MCRAKRFLEFYINALCRYNNKALDLSRTVRLAGLVGGAKIELVQGSRSPTSVLVGLQLQGSPRLTEKFASNTTLWQILRHFESKHKNLNLTGRGVPAGGQDATAGRMNYEMPVLNVMGRERGTFVELQQTLSQLGASKDILLRLSFRNSGKPLMEAHEEISQYFAEVEQPAQQASEPKPTQVASAPETAPPTREVTDEQTETTPMEDVTSTPTPPPSVIASQPAPIPPDESALEPPVKSPVVKVFAPSASPTPQAARIPDNQSDYELSVDQAKQHQARLQEASRNKRLLSDKEIAEQERLKAEKLNAVKDVCVRVRLPDLTQVETNMDRNHAATDVYNFVREMLEYPNEEWSLSYRVATSMVPLKDGPQKLIADLGFQGRILFTFIWGDHVSGDKKRAPPLKKQWRDQAQSLKIDSPKDTPAQPTAETGTATASKAPVKPKMSDSEKESKLKNLLGKGLFKKK